MNVRRLILAIAVSAAAVVPLYLALSVLTGDLDNMFLPIALVAVLGISTVSVLIVGLPVHLVLVRLNKNKAFTTRLAVFQFRPWRLQLLIRLVRMERFG